VVKEAAVCMISATSFVAGGVWWTQPGTEVIERVISQLRNLNFSLVN